ncbi:glycosyltransferase family 4 protein [Halopiger aswanensis]|uniref:Glycosyltransferase involved in cell wall biosynthesis n=1 Tax=Halopiger aswanensis TaxID=148449 RepID=A0A3R7E1V4_9EURY|nr:glycosyltransferase family 4 protein [Halopiger aswanensis]RKD98059.1 glycosyltransferase involved in cell wall biosynthesis [Halopiger aswanensis]
MPDDDDICVVTQPVSSASQSHVETLVEILGAITTVSLLTANLPNDSSIRDDHEVIDIAMVGTGSSISTAAIRFLQNQIRMAREIWGRDESIVLFFGTTAYLIPLLAAKASGKTVVLEPRGDVPLTLRLHWEERVPSAIARGLAGSIRLLEEIGYRLADAIITYTPSMAKELKLERFEEKLYPHGARYIDTDRFSPRISYDERNQIVGFLGRLDEEKGIRELAEVAKHLSDDIMFVFAGDGDLKEWLEAELSDEINSGAVELTGWIDREDVPKVLSRFGLLVLPSQPTEGLPTVILESFACGTPVYATPVSGIPDVVREDETGMRMSNRNPRTIAARIEDFYSRDDRHKMSANGRQLAKSEYSFQAATQRYQEILSNIG